MTPPLRDAARLALGTLTVLRVPAPSEVDQARAGWAMVGAPAVGALLGGAAALVGYGALRAGVAPLGAAVVAVAVLALLSGGLHLDGLADTADGLGCRRPAPEALAVMRRSDVGPLGVAAVVLVLLADVAALAQLWARSAAVGAAGLVVAAVTGRVAVTMACRRGVPAARGDGLGAAVAGSVPPFAAAATGLVVLGLAAALSGATWAGSAGSSTAQWALTGALTGALGVAVGLAAAALLRHRCRVRFGGVTGDVLGALVETATAATLLTLAAGT